MVDEAQVLKALKGVNDPELGKSLVELGMVHDVEMGDGVVRFTLALTTLACPLKERIVADARQAVLALDGVQEVQVDLREMRAEEKERIWPQQPQQREPGVAAHLNNVGRVVAVMSGKGGVGKSLVSSLLAVALRRHGERVGVLDADITGPSIPKMFGITARPTGSDNGILPVLSRSGIAVMSINLLLPSEDDAVIWRGPLISNTIKQFGEDVLWGKLDYLIIDLPPGTADAPLTVMQSFPISGVIIVFTPQDLTTMIVRKAISMAQKMDKPVLGVVENMAYLYVPEIDKRI
ncbi:MAG: Mrp/NBP35 family ATP-binding protein, partial [Anaerolineae bacterium]|nr:Mrp/NBP35 family ATP-binding protein [Anaerolineae bacterium]